MMNSNTLREPVTVYSTDDGLFTPPVGSWAVQKYRLVGLYNELFSTGMKGRWDRRVYIDLFAGSGKARLRDTGKIVLASPLLALSVPNPYDRYIFCERNNDAMNALKERVKALNTNLDVHFVDGDCNERIDTIISTIPRYSSGTKVLSFCFVDPFSLNIHFETIRKLGNYIMDFLVLLMLSDPLRNEDRYTEKNSDRIELFLGFRDWREKWNIAKARGTGIRKFLATEFARQMITVGYKEESLSSMVEVRSDDKNLPLYHLAFFSKHPLGYKFWSQVRKYASEQTSFEF
jgi:three-Cys-motif partner protein